MFDGYLTELWIVLLELSPALILGLLLAGVLRVYFPDGLVRAHLSQPTLGSAVRAALIGVPMPLCSCGVVPTAIGLRNQGASKGATTSFLISTPQTGVDSVLVSAAFLGWPFALFKVVAAFVTGVAGGWLVSRLTDEGAPVAGDDEQGEHWRAAGNRLTAVLRYALFDILAAIDLWLIAGILLAAAVTTAVPPDYFQHVAWSQGLPGMFLVLAIALPMYVCTTSSVPIAASLIAAGMPAGSALVFLMAGPATNIATMGAIYRALGGRVLALYLGTVIVASIGLGMGFEFVLGDTATDAPMHRHLSAAWWEIGAAIVLVGLMAFLLLRRGWQRYLAPQTGAQAGAGDVIFSVEGMTCQHCVANVKNALQSVDEVEHVTADLQSGIVRVEGTQLQPELLRAVIMRAGYKVDDAPG
ncbi:MAG: permease [Sedimenticolaceae bacterium]